LLYNGNQFKILTSFVTSGHGSNEKLRKQPVPLQPRSGFNMAAV
jgi:hypothetical protein